MTSKPNWLYTAIFCYSDTLGSQYSERGVDVSEDSSIVPRPPAQELPDIAQSAEEGNSLQRTHINVSTESSRTERFPYTWNSNVSSSQQEAKVCVYIGWMGGWVIVRYDTSILCYIRNTKMMT